MDIYTNTRPTTKLAKAVLMDQQLSLEDVINRGNPTQKQVIAAFCNDLKGLLEVDDLRLLIADLFAIEHRLAVLQEVEEDMELPQFGEFYNNLSPLLLRSILEHSDQEVTKGWKEALRIAIEEELYFWKEKLF